MVRFIHRALAWTGGHMTSERTASGPGRYAGAALIGLALAAAFLFGLFGLLGWRLWLMAAGRSFSAGLALVFVGFAAALFRQLARASEAATSTVQRLAIKLTATLLLLPGAYMAGTWAALAIHVSRSRGATLPLPSTGGLASNRRSIEVCRWTRSWAEAAARCRAEGLGWIRPTGSWRVRTRAGVAVPMWRPRMVSSERSSALQPTAACRAQNIRRSTHAVGRPLSLSLRSTWPRSASPSRCSSV